eukprot:3092410-Pyramimonas_sp.AAC.1
MYSALHSIANGPGVRTSVPPDMTEAVWVDSLNGGVLFRTTNASEAANAHQSGRNARLSDIHYDCRRWSSTRGRWAPCSGAGWRAARRTDCRVAVSPACRSPRPVNPS